MTCWKKILLITLLGCGTFVEGAASTVPYQDDHVRFTLITPSVVRVEWSSNGQFVDNPSLIASVRETPVVPFRCKEKKDKVVIRTSEIQLSYLKSGDSLTQANLSIESLDGELIWYPDKQQTGNLMGTYRTLDLCMGDQVKVKNEKREFIGWKPLQLEQGLLARCGWTLINDSKGLLFDNTEQPWVITRSDTTAQDWYIMLYGKDYKKALHDFTVFAGTIPLPPRFAFGFWWSRYWEYSADDIRQLVSNFRHYGFPLSVMVVDMDWHYSDGIRGGWTGYTWNKELFPDPEGLLKELHDAGLKVTLNLHPADGILPYEESFPRMMKSLGLTDSTQAIPWQSSNKQFMNAWMEQVLRPIEKQGVDFWWLDWQQFLNDKKIPQLSNTFWLNYFVFSDFERNRTERPILYHRWGGLGNHRYQVGFSGDTYTRWASLRYQPYFNHTASNVLYGYWSHDLGGHTFWDKQNEVLDDELYMRWTQFGAFSPIMRTHSTKNARLIKEPWLKPDSVMEVLREAVLARYRFIPYIYSMAWKAHQTGVCLCRPLYYDWPDAEQAYDIEWRNEYMFGDAILVAPITDPMENNISTLRIWLPEGQWYEVKDWMNGDLAEQTLQPIEGNQVIERTYTIHEYPLFVKAGSIIPTANDAGGITLNAFHCGKSVFELYQDEGDNQDYDAHHLLTKIQYNGKKIKIKETCLKSQPFVYRYY